MAYKMGYDYKKWRNKDQQKKVFPFSSQKKKMCTVYADDKGVKYAFVKGAPDFLIPYCSKYINRSGSVSKMNNDFTNSLNENILDFAAASLRTILLAYKEVQQVPQDWDEV